METGAFDLAAPDTIEGRLRDFDTALPKGINNLQFGHAGTDEIAQSCLWGCHFAQSMRMRIRCKWLTHWGSTTLANKKKMVGMGHRTFTFREAIEAAAKPHRELWKSSGELNMNAVARYLAKHDHPVTQSTLSRHYNDEHAYMDPETVEAVSVVFGLQRAILRKEPLGSEMEELLKQFTLSTLLLAKRIENLGEDGYKTISNTVAVLEDKDAQLKRARENQPPDKKR